MATKREITSLEKDAAREYLEFMGLPKEIKIYLPISEAIDAYKGCAKECFEKAEKYFAEIKANLQSDKQLTVASLLAPGFTELAIGFSNGAREMMDLTEQGQLGYRTAVRMAALERTGTPQAYSNHPYYRWSEIFDHLPENTRARIFPKPQEQRPAA